jgi:hypothetical protein
MSNTKALIGIDWGTHSSKWTWSFLETDSQVTSGQFFRILRSDVRLDDSQQIFLSTEEPPSGSTFEVSLKGTLIRDPYGSFWDGHRKRSKLSLGELVSFSLWFLLSEAYESLSTTIGVEPDIVEIRFSLPNWVGSDNAAAARSSYEQAARVACQIFAKERRSWSRESTPSREGWHVTVEAVLDELGISDDIEANTATQDFATLLQHTFLVSPGITFRFVAESSAAGLTGLLDIEAALEGHKYLRKILVVDVGAGSTDIGYVLRTIPPGGGEALIQLPPANTCRFADEELSRSIVEIYRSRGKRITDREAEIIKTVGEDKDWLTRPAVDEWRSRIADHVLSYVSDLPDRRWLPEEPALQVLITGGSGVVIGLGEKVLEAAKKGLERYAAPRTVIDATSLMNLSLEGPAANDANRLAVALGAASNDFPKLDYFTELGPPMPHPPIRRAPGWTG